MTDCPELRALEQPRLTSSIQAHLSRCDACKLVVDMLAAAPRIEDCGAFDALLAARADHVLDPASENLLARHLASCSECRAVVETRSPIDDTTRDREALPEVDPAGYMLGLEVARGGMGRILAARDVRVGRPVAVKELLGRNPGLAARFEREARVTARLQHPGIIPIYEIGRWPDGTPFYSMRMVDGRTLREAIDEAPTLAARLGLLPALIAASEAVAFAHSQRVIHRDLTPSNILVGAYGETVVIDWGLAKDLTQPAATDELPEPHDDARPTGLTRMGSVMGTVEYMPPEQAHARPVDERADVYSLGAILYYLLSGTAPYGRRPGGTKLLRTVRSEPPVPIDTLVPNAPRELVSIVGKAMARDPETRYPTARELADELKRFQAGRMVEAHHYSRRDKLARFIHKYRAAVTVTVLAMIVLTTFGSLSLIGILRTRAEARATVRELLLEKGRVELLGGNTLRALAYLEEVYQHGERSPSLQFLLASALHGVTSASPPLDCGGDVRLVELSPDGNAVAAACNDVAKIWQLDGDHSLIASFGPIGGGFHGIRFSHDGASVVTWGEDGVARLWNVRSGAQRSTLTHGAPITFARFTPDDRRITTTGFDGVARIWDVTTQRELLRIEASTSLLRHLYGLLSPDGRHLMTVTIEGQGKGWDVETGKLLGGFSHGSLVFGGDLSPDGKLALTCGQDRLAKVWDATTGQLVATFAGHTDVIWKCVFSADSTRVLTTGHDGRANVWDLTTGALVTSITHGDIIWSGHFAPDGRRFATIGVDGRVKVWDANSGALLASRDSLRGKDAVFTPDGQRLVVQRGDGRIQIWSDASSQLAAFAPPNDSPLIAVGGDGLRVATEAHDGAVTIWNTRSARPLTHEAIRRPVAAAANRLAATTDRGVVIVDTGTGSTLVTLAIKGPPAQLQLSANGNRLAVISATGAPEVWDVASRARVAAFESMKHVLLSDDGGRAIAWADDIDPTVWVLDGATRKIATLDRLGRARPIGFGDQGSRVIAVHGSDDAIRSLSIWDADTAERVSPPSDARGGNDDQTMTVPRLDPSGRWLTTIRSDHRVTVWNVRDGSVHSSFFADQLLTAQADRNGALVVAIGEYGTVALVMSATDGRILARWPIEHTAPLVTQQGFEPPSGTAWWSPDGTTIVSRSSNVAVWQASADTTKIGELMRRNVPWRVVDGHLDLVRNLRLHGAVTRAGHPVRGAAIEIEIRMPAEIGPTAMNWESTKGRVTRWETRSEDDGTFAIESLLPGSYKVTVTDGKAATTTEVFVSPDDEHLAIELAP